MKQGNIQILLVDDEKNIRRSISLLLEDAGYTVAVAEDAIRGLEKLRQTNFDLVVLDIKMGEISGLQLFEKMRAEKINVPVIFMSGNASLSEAVETIKLGGADFLEKPFEPEQLLICLTRALRLGELERELRTLKQNNHRSKTPRDDLLGKSKGMESLWEQVEKAASTKAKILIHGETGTGKELIARAVHQLSQQAEGPFIKVNCAAIPEDLIESELFGHEKGSFTGAHQLKKGLFELAHRGTLFLDEIGEMSAGAQAKVLRILQQNELTRVGGSQVVRVDVRVLAATHRDLIKEVREGRFREDLYFRINVVPLSCPALRERKEDIPLLLSRFVHGACAENGVSPKDISVEVLDCLLAYSWPGNVRELKNLAERLVVFSGDEIQMKDMPPGWGTESCRSNADSALEGSASAAEILTLESFKARTEKQYLISVLQKCRGNITQAAKLLDLERTYLHRKIQDHQIQKKEYF